MKTPELKKYGIIGDPNPYVRLADAMAYTQAAIAAAMMGAIDELLAFRGPVDVPRTDKAIIQDDAINRCIEILNDHIPTDPMAALEAVKAQVRDHAFGEALNRIRKLRGEGWESAPAVHPYDKGYLAALDAMSRTIRAMKDDTP